MLKIITRNVVDKIVFLLFMDTLPKKEVILESFSSFISTLLFETKFKRVGSNEKVITKDKIGRNDLCYCGSGKKYKKCGLVDKCIKKY